MAERRLLKLAPRQWDLLLLLELLMGPEHLTSSKEMIRYLLIFLLVPQDTI